MVKEIKGYYDPNMPQPFEQYIYIVERKGLTWFLKVNMRKIYHRKSKARSRYGLFQTIFTLFKLKQKELVLNLMQFLQIN